MKTNSWKTLLSIVCATWIFGGAVPDMCEAQGPGVPQAVVEALTGTVTMSVDQDEEPVALSSGSVLNAWNMVSTDEASKLLLNWSTGMLNSLGPYTSIFLTSNQTEQGPLDSIEMTEGILRVNTPGAGDRAPYMVSTPVAQIEPVKPNEPVDFIVEVHDPATTSVTVIAGLVRVRNMTLKEPSETMLSGCQNVYVEGGKPAANIAALTANDMTGLVEASTIPGSIPTTFMCPTPTAELPPPPPSSSYVPSYVYEDWGSYDFYPFDQITIDPPRPGVGCVVVLPGIGRWVIPVDVFAGWRFDPVLVRIYCRHVIMDHMMYCDRYYLTDMRLRQRQLRHMVYLAQLSGNRSMLVEAQRKLADINVRSHWAAMRLKRLENNVAGLQKEQQKFVQNLPQGRNLFQGISNSFNSPKNLTVARDFRNRVNADLSVQRQLARMTGKELNDLRSRIAQERNPRQRMALREQLVKFNNDVAQGKIPIPAKDTQLKQAVNRIVKERDPNKLKDLEKQFDRVAKIDMPHTSQVLSQKQINALKENLGKYPNTQKRRDLEQQVSQLQRSVQARTAAEQQIQKIDTISAEAARQQDPRKRNELLGQLKSLSQTAVPAAGLAAGLHQLGQRQLLETQLSLEKDKQKRATLEKSLEDQRKVHSDMMRQHQERLKGAAQGHQQELRRQSEQKLPEHGGAKPTGQVMPVQPERLDLQKQQSDQLRKQKEQADRMRQQQDQAEKMKQKEQSERLRHQQEQSDQLRKQKEHADRMRQQQDQADKMKQKEQSERLRHQQEQSDQLRKQKEQADRMRQQQDQAEKMKQKEQSERLRHQQEQSDQLRKQKEHADRMRQQQDQADKMKQKEQSERLRHQQEQSEQLRKQKEQADRMRQQQEQAERMRQKEQSERLRHQQQQQTEQLRRQKEQADRMRHQQEQADRARMQQKQSEQLRQHQNRQQQQDDDPRRRLQPPR